MTHPHTLHATAAAWALRAARGRLVELAGLEARANATRLLDAAAVLRSPAWGRRHALGGHSDPTSAVLTAPDEHETSWRELLDRLDRKVTWIADAIGCTPPAVPNPLDRILGGLPYLRRSPGPLAAAHLWDEDRWVREAVGLAPARRPLPGIACPACGLRALAVLDGGPVTEWTVVCDCRCAGAQCGCGMTVRAAGIQHIWPRAQVIGTAAGVAPPEARAK